MFRETFYCENSVIFRYTVCVRVCVCVCVCVQFAEIFSECVTFMNQRVTATYVTAIVCRSVSYSMLGMYVVSVFN
jgi:hypothetical protein